MLLLSKDTSTTVIAAASCLHFASFAKGWSKDELDDLLAGAGAFGFAEQDENKTELTGFILCKSSGAEAEIYTICVHPKARKKGIGMRLLSAALAHAATLGVKKMFLEVDEVNAAALALYASAGFAKIGERKGYYAHKDAPATSALTMAKDL